MKIDIQIMSEKDIEEVSNIEKHMFSQPWSKDSLKSALQRQDTCFIIAKHTENIIGYCGYYCVQDEAEVTNVAVVKEFQRKGVALLLLNEMIKKCNFSNINNVFLEVRESNINAINLYKKIGFESQGMRKNFYIKPLENAIVMCKYLSQTFPLD